MDLQEIETQAHQILVASSRFATTADRTSVVDVTYNNDPTWRSDPIRLRLNSRAIDLLLRSGYLTVGNPPSTIELTATGRETIQNSSELRFEGDWIEPWVENEELREAFDSQNRISANTFSGMQLDDWRQFSSVDITFHPHLTILTGANATGKTTILNVLAPHLNWQAQLVVGAGGSEVTSQTRKVGSLSYTNGGNTDLVENPGVGIRNAPLVMVFPQQVPGLFISSHRSISAYQPLSALPPRFSESETLLSQFASEIQTRYAGGATQHSPLYRMKESLYAAAMYAYGSPAVEANAAARDVWEGFQEILRNFLPASLQFAELKASNAEVILKTTRTQFPLEAVSGGISAMIELAWQIFLRSRNQESFTVCIDEPENHLHPELQRSIMPSLLRAFPDVSFVVATHSPFVVTSAPDASVFALSREGDDTGVTSRRIDGVNFSATADETLLSVLGLDTSLPIWAEDRLKELLASLDNDPSSADLQRLREGLDELGLSRQFPAAVKSISSEIASDQVT